MLGRPWWEKNPPGDFHSPLAVACRQHGSGHGETKIRALPRASRYRGCSCQGPEQRLICLHFLDSRAGNAQPAAFAGSRIFGHGARDGEPAGLVVTRAASRARRDTDGGGNFCCVRSSRRSGLQRGDERGVISPPAGAVSDQTIRQVLPAPVPCSRHCRKIRIQERAPPG